MADGLSVVVVVLVAAFAFAGWTWFLTRDRDKGLQEAFNCAAALNVTISKMLDKLQNEQVAGRDQLHIMLAQIVQQSLNRVSSSSSSPVHSAPDDGVPSFTGSPAWMRGVGGNGTERGEDGRREPPLSPDVEASYASGLMREHAERTGKLHVPPQDM